MQPATSAISPRAVPTHRTLAQLDHLYRPIVQTLTVAERIAIARRTAEMWESMAGDMERAAVAWREHGRGLNAGTCLETAAQYRDEASAYRAIEADLAAVSAPAMQAAAE